MRMRSILAIACLLATNAAFAQTINAAQTLRLARSTYEQGRLHDLKGVLEPKMGEFNTEQLVEAYKLLTLANIYQEEPEEADKAMLTLLQTDPEFRPNTDVDPAEFVALYRTFRTDPIYRLGVKAGANASQPNVQQFTPLNEGTEIYEYGFGFNVGVAAEFPLLKGKFTLMPEVNFQTKSFSFVNDFFENDQHTEGKERLRWINIPVSVRYPLHVYKKPENQQKNVDGIVPFVAAGISVDLLASVSSEMETTISDESPVNSTSDDKSQYRSFAFAPIISAGVTKKIKKAELIAEVRYCFGMNTIYNEERIYDSQGAIFDNKFIHGPFSMNTLSISFGYLINKYNPRKKTTH